MTASQIGRYSKYIRPISVSIDLIIISMLSLSVFKELDLDIEYYLIYQAIGWIIAAFFIRFYDIYRFTTPIEIISKIIKQGVLFLLIIISFFPFSKQVVFSGEVIAMFISSVILLITISKFLLFYYLKEYRILTGSNFRNTVIIGYTPEAIQLKDLFETRNDYGYRFLGYFSDKKSNQNIKGKLADLKPFVIENCVDEIYCSLNEISNEHLKDLIDFADENNKTIKFIPDTKEIFSKNLKIDYYEFFPVLSLKKTMLHEPATKVFKRFFDIVFSLIIIVFLLSWLIPLVAILIKLESRGPVFFKQGRPGIDENEFFCYKLRSMKINKITETEASKNDPRVTRIGKFMRKTSMDEMPQFLNVLLGDMSVVGPRPHLWAQNKVYGNTVKKYMVRHYVKPGITGLAQVKGFRGEIETEGDMINRIKFDVFYIENWSLILDLKIIFQTVVNILKGEEKAY
ncbi:undecaprenyl-phosphate glucose phosphotransferase [Flavobacterium gawalongense]|uniref:Undecaprenyl-phosphate glucose phosphotransferase n=1 Tax=Flavobacterium gawalongense TaxID=2594432 RepID=A0A553BWK3_9FLAO|nr:undecaprenyl-phosphate glucose phosphotransferase [Flavobacterium gawalongense]TRX09716.1 undecaprenyl-phosphate glucose phosphotransferase [Flavobacterium gawalongense]TRX12593.1 undecaprenyl-phosphate glucose phosphotransferase [Flavobacterium gawalongense]TRX26839.1 undecaprenyl-phosphate glucose phosphotransferase [Flavobacterium gawalongense]